MFKDAYILRQTTPIKKEIIEIVSIKQEKPNFHYSDEDYSSNFIEPLEQYAESKYNFDKNNEFSLCWSGFLITKSQDCIRTILN